MLWPIDDIVEKAKIKREVYAKINPAKKLMTQIKTNREKTRILYLNAKFAGRNIREIRKWLKRHGYELVDKMNTSEEMLERYVKQAKRRLRETADKTIYTMTYQPMGYETWQKDGQLIQIQPVFDIVAKRTGSRPDDIAVETDIKVKGIYEVIIV